MKKKILALVLASAMIASMAACGDETASITSISISETPITEVAPQVSETSTQASTEASVEEPEPEVIPENSYRSELTNEWISNDLKNQRPIAVMVDNESKAYPHMGLNNADVVYELMNSTANGRVTRLMCLVKDYNSLVQFGSVRSTRPTNVLLAAEWNAILIHDGGPYYINEYLAYPWSNNLSGGFARFSNGKSSEFTEYVTSEDYYNADKGQTYSSVSTRIKNAGYDVDYNEYYQGNHFTFAESEKDYSERADAVKVSQIDFPYPHNSSQLKYNEETKTYDYYCYGEAHIDPLDDDKVMSFKNVILYSCDYSVYDEHGYLLYNCIGAGDQGWYLTNGYAIPIHWAKPTMNEQTIYYDLTMGGQLQLNTGKTYITLVPSDVYGDLIMK